LTVDFASGTSPSSSTDDAVLAGLVNWYLVGGEVVGVVTWTLVSGTRYAGTRLARGLMDTAEQVGLHAAVESVVEIRSSGALGVKTYTPGLVGSLRYYKTAALNGDPASMTAKTITLNASSIRPFAPCDVAGARNDPSSNDWTLTWKPRTRLPLWDTLGAIPFDDAESSEVYELEVWDSTYATLKRTITATASGNGSVITTTTPNAPSCLYDADDQVADFGSAQATIYLRIFQVGASSGLRSKKLQVSFTG
jgi:hypothetical protein